MNSSEIGDLTASTQTGRMGGRSVLATFPVGAVVTLGAEVSTDAKPGYSERPPSGRVGDAGPLGERRLPAALGPARPKRTGHRRAIGAADVAPADAASPTGASLGALGVAAR